MSTVLFDRDTDTHPLRIGDIPSRTSSKRSLAMAMLDVMENLLVSLRAGVSRRPEKKFDEANEAANT